MDIPFFGHAPIDIHTHFNHGAALDCPETEVHLRSFAFIKGENDRIGVRQAGYSTYASVLHDSCICEENAYLADLAAQEPSVYQWVVVDPRQQETFDQAEKLLSSPKCLGIKIHPDNHGYRMEQYGDRLFSFADAHGAVVLMHPQNNAIMADFANRYPNMTLIIAHLGSVSHVEAVKNAKYGNIYVDTSAGGSGLNNVLEYAVQQVGADKILFGTDTYAYSFEYCRVAFSTIAEADKQKILYQNALRLFPCLARDDNQ